METLHRPQHRPAAGERVRHPLCNAPSSASAVNGSMARALPSTRSLCPACRSLRPARRSQRYGG
eukprot:365613-Chlamydomonas_euryale.AAC.2